MASLKTEAATWDLNQDDEGSLQNTPDKVIVQHNRFEYRYDAHRNWVERIVLIRPESNPEFQPSNIERRAIAYHG